jgi:hypothetical protein
MPRLWEISANLLKKPLERDMFHPGTAMMMNKINGRMHGEELPGSM